MSKALVRHDHNRSRLDVAREDVRILSLGTGESTFTVDERARLGGIKEWAFLRSFNAAARAQSRNALGQAYLLVGKNNVTRIDVPESDAPIAMDDVQCSVRELPKRHDMTMDASGVGHNGGRLLRAPALSEDETRFQVVEIEIAQFLDDDRLVIKLAFLSGIVPLRNSAQLNLGLFSRKLRRPDAMQPDRIAT